MQWPAFAAVPLEPSKNNTVKVDASRDLCTAVYLTAEIVHALINFLQIFASFKNGKQCFCEKKIILRDTPPSPQDITMDTSDWRSVTQNKFITPLHSDVFGNCSLIRVYFLNDSRGSSFHIILYISFT
jgi:hypothetical protein